MKLLLYYYFTDLSGYADVDVDVLALSLALGRHRSRKGQCDIVHRNLVVAERPREGWHNSDDAVSRGCRRKRDIELPAKKTGRRRSRATRVRSSLAFVDGH